MEETTTVQFRGLDRNESVREAVEGIDGADRHSTTATDRLSKDRKARGFALIVLSVLSLMAVVQFSIMRPAAVTSQHTFIPVGSKDYVFGFVSAAMAVCRSAVSIDWQQLPGKFSAPIDGALSADVSIGFADFDRVRQRAGIDAACQSAIKTLEAVH